MKKKKPNIPIHRSLITVEKDSVVMKSTFQEAMSLLGSFQEDLKEILSAILTHKEATSKTENARQEDLQLYEKCEQIAFRKSIGRLSTTQH